MQKKQYDHRPFASLIKDTEFAEKKYIFFKAP